MNRYDEYEESVTGQRRRRMGPLAWLAVTFAGIAFFGITALTVGGIVVSKKIKHTIEEFERQPTQAVAERVVASNPQMEWISSDATEGTVTYRNLQTNQVETQDIEDIVDGRLTFKTRDGDVVLDLKGGHDGGRLLIRTPDETIRVGLDREAGGGLLTLSSGDGEVAIRLQGDEDGGHLTVLSDDGETMFELSGDESDGFELRTPNGVTHINGFDEGGEAPSWVPVLPGARDLRVFAGESPEGEAGAVVYETSDDTEGVMASYEALLEDMGAITMSQSFSFRSETRQGTLKADLDDGERTLLIFTARGSHGRTKVVAAYADRR